MGDEDERARVALERELELLDRLQVEMVRRLIEHERVRALRREQGEHRARPLARGERRRRPLDLAGSERELGEQRSGVARRQPRRPCEELEERALGVEPGPVLLQLAEADTRPGVP